MRKTSSVVIGVALAMLGVAAYSAAPNREFPSLIALANMPRIGTVDERFQSYNIEMVEVIGGRFWKPYGSSAANNSNAQEPARQEGFTPAGTNPNLYQYRAH
jgi:heparanase